MITTIVKGKTNDLKSFLEEIYGENNVEIDYSGNEPTYISLNCKKDNIYIDDYAYVRNEETLLDVSRSNDPNEYIIQIILESLLEDPGVYEPLQAFSKKYNLEIKAFSFSDFYLAVSYSHYKNGEELEDIFKHYCDLFDLNKEENNYEVKKN